MNQKYLSAFANSPNPPKKGKEVCFEATVQNIASFIVENSESAEVLIETLDGLPLMTARYGIVNKCFDKKFLLNELYPVILPMQMDGAPTLFTEASRDEVFAAYTAPMPDWNFMREYMSDEEFEQHYDSIKENHEYHQAHPDELVDLTADIDDGLDEAYEDEI